MRRGEHRRCRTVLRVRSLAFGLQSSNLECAEARTWIPFLPFAGIAKPLRGLSPLVFALTRVSIFAAMLGFAWLALRIGEPVTWPMWILPFVGSMSNDMKRIEIARTGATPVRHMLEAEGRDYDAGIQVATGKGLAGGIVLCGRRHQRPIDVNFLRRDGCGPRESTRRTALPDSPRAELALLQSPPEGR